MFAPHGRAARLATIALDDLHRRGVRGIILDLDNTLLPYGQAEIDVENLAWVRNAMTLGFSIVLVSNNFPPRVRAVASILGVRYIASALKPSPIAFWRARKVLGLPRREVMVIGDQLLTDILGAGLAGLRGILTEPIIDRDFPLTRLMRRIERLLYAREKGRS